MRRRIGSCAARHVLVSSFVGLGLLAGTLSAQDRDGESRAGARGRTSQETDSGARRPAGLQDIDRNGDGRLDDRERALLRRQLQQAARRSGVDLETLIDRIDQNDDGEIDLRELARARAARDRDTPPTRPDTRPPTVTPRPGGDGDLFSNRESLLRRFDENGNGRFDAAEMRRLQVAVTRNPQMRSAVLERFDVDGDGELSNAERARIRAFLEGRAADRTRPGARPAGDGLPAATPPEPRLDLTRLLERFDTDGNGRLDADERAAAYASVRRQKEDADGR